MTVGSFIQQAREHSKLSRQALALRCGVARTYIYSIELGINTPSAPLCEALAQVLDLDRDEVLLLAGHVPPDLLALLQRNPKAGCELFRRELLHLV